MASLDSTGCAPRTPSPTNPPGRSPLMYTPTGGVVVDGTYICRANDAIFCKMVASRSDMDDNSFSFRPAFTHQIFKGEKIRGYKNLKIELFFAKGSLVAYLRISYDLKLDDESLVDDIAGGLSKRLIAGYLTNEAEFLNVLDRETEFEPFGETIHIYERIFLPLAARLVPLVQQDPVSDVPSTSPSVDSASSASAAPSRLPRNRTSKRSRVEEVKWDISYEIRLSKFDNAGFRKYHERLQFFLLFFIDASSYIDSEDLVWKIMCVYEKSICRKTKRRRYSLLGYCTLYSFLCFPYSQRLRISQILVLPPYQRHGHGQELLQAIYDYAKECDYAEVNVEDPSIGFQFLRDKTDMANCISAGIFQKCSTAGTRSGTRNLPTCLKIYSKSYEKKVKKKLRITDNQIRRCYEAFKLGAINLEDVVEYKNYRLEVKKRLFEVFTEELVIFFPDAEEKRRRLSEVYLELESKYTLLLSKLEKRQRRIFRALPLK